MSGSPSFSKQLWVGGINRDRTAMLMSVGSRIRNFRVRHGHWQLVHHHRVGGVTTDAAWEGLGAAFGIPYMDAILSCGDLRMLNKFLYTTSKLKTRGEDASQELSVKDGKRYKESISAGVLIPHKDPLFLI